MNRLLSFLITLVCFSFSSCIEFEREKIAYVHDEEKDELRVTLTYEGIFGNLEKGQNSQHGPDDITTADSLNKQQIEQLESVLEQKRAFFFSNWIFEYSASSSAKMLEKIIKENGQGKFGEAEKKLIKSLLDNIEVQNIGFYKNNAEQLCGAQTLRISNISVIIPLANQVIGRQMKAHIQEMREEREEKVPNSFTTETIDLIENKVEQNFPFIQVKGNLITLTLIMTEPDQTRITNSTVKDLPDGARIAFEDEALLIEIGGKQDQVGELSKNCFEGYYDNAKNFLETSYPNLFFTPTQVENRLKKFLNLSGR